MFWNLVLEPGKRYSSVVGDSFHLSMATLDVKSVKSDTDVFPVQVSIDDKEVILCNLNKTQFLQVNLDHVFERGSNVTFFTSGKATIHLTGYIIQDDLSDMSDPNMSDESDSEDQELPGKDLSKLNKTGQGDSKVELQKKNKRKLNMSEEIAKKKSKAKLDDSDDAEDSDDEDDDSDELGTTDISAFNGFKGSDSDDDEDEDDDNDNDDDDDDEDDDDDGDDDENTSLGGLDDEDDDSESESDEKVKPQKTPQQTPKKNPNEKTPVQGKSTQKQTPVSNKKQNKPNQSITNGATPKSDKKGANKGTPQQQQQQQQGKQQGATPQKKTLAGGVIIEDLKTANGPVAKAGKLVSVYYTGRLKSNNRVFDQSNSGPGFKFRLGRGEVIKGWDVGVAGMTVGSKRRITCPAAMAYGSKGSQPSIPPNATLVFDVEVKSVN